MPVRLRVAAAGIGVLLAAALLCGCSAARPPKLLLLLTVDTLRADRLGAYGSERGLTPHLDALARESVVFDHVYAPTSFTLPSISSLLTGRYPEEIGVLSNESRLAEAVPTLATRLSRCGFRTAAVVGNFVLRAAAGLDRDFDVYNDAFEQVEAIRKWPERIAADTTDAALRELEACAAAEARCFLWVHYQDPHGPYTPPDELRARYLARERADADGTRRLPLRQDHKGEGGIPKYQALGGEREVAFYRAGYDAEIRYLDGEVARLLAALADRPFDDAIVAFAADHGEALGESDLWFAHGEHLIDPLVRVPLLVRAPGLAPARRTDVAALVDVAPTLLARVTGEPPPPELEGRDLFAPGAEAQASVPYLSSLASSRVVRFAIVDEGFKFAVAERDGVWDGRLTRIDREDVDLTAAAPQVAAALRTRLQGLRRRMQRGREELRQELAPEDREHLRALGYVEGD